METIPFFEFAYGEIDAFRILCHRYQHHGPDFHVEAVVPQLSPTNIYPRRRVWLRHAPTGVWRIYPGGSEDAWLIEFERDLSNHVFSHRLDGAH
jgi:hypothetical protein